MVIKLYITFKVQPDDSFRPCVKISHRFPIVTLILGSIVHQATTGMASTRTPYLPAVLGFFWCGYFLLSPVKCVPTSPLHASDVLGTFRINNHQQCQRLCWYQKLCVRHSSYNKNDNPARDNCVLHLDASLGGGELLEGWSEEEASGAYLVCTA